MSGTTVRAVRLLAVLVLSGVLGSCGDSPTAPARRTLTGTWVSADRSFTWVLVQSGTTVTGTHTSTGGEPPVAISGSVSGAEFSFSVITGERVDSSVDPPRPAPLGWSARVDVDGDRMTGSIYPIWSAYRWWFRDITMRRVESTR